MDLYIGSRQDKGSSWMAMVRERFWDRFQNTSLRNWAMGLFWSQEPDRSKPRSVLGMSAKMHRAVPRRLLGFCKFEEWLRPENQELPANPARRAIPENSELRHMKSSPQCTTLNCLALWGPPGSPSSSLRTPGPRPQSGLHPESLGQASELEVVAEGAPTAVSSPSRANGTPEGTGCLCR